MTGPFEDFLTAALRDLELTAEQSHIIEAIDTLAEKRPLFLIDPAQIFAKTYHLPVSHELLCDYTGHQCTADCPPPRIPPSVPFRRRVRYALRRGWWQVTGLRIAHRSRIDNDADDQ